VPLAKGLDLDGAVRYEKYSDFGKTTNPKLGLTWAPVDSVSFRGSWGRSFRAPDLPSLNENTVRILIPVPQLNAVTNIIPPSFCAPTGCFSTMLLAIGSNSDLGPERAKTWSAGFDFTPQWLTGFKTSLTYYNVSYKDRIVAPIDNYTDTAEHYALYQKYVVLTPPPAGCVNTDPATWNPALVEWMSEPNVFGTPAQFWPGCQIQAVLNRFTHNDASTRQDGIDLTMNYAFDTSMGAWNLNLTASKILSATQHLIDGGPESDALGRINYPVKLRGRGGVTWNRGGLSANVWLNYVDSYRNDLPITVLGVRKPVSEVPSWTTVDASLTYRIEKGSAAPWLGGTRVSLAVQNLFDRDPPVVLSTANADGFDAQNAQVFGATWQLELSKAF
jgi:iron complex outermembrane receptor protein